jgi:hypothetical protein
MRITFIASITTGILISISAGAQISPSPTQAPAITPLGPQRQQPPAQQQPLGTIDRSPQPTQIMNLPGVLVGYVYWDTSSPARPDGLPVISGSVAGTSYVSRFYKGTKFDPTGKSPDLYNFTHLAPGWTSDSFQLTTYPQLCFGTVTYSQDFGQWNGHFGDKNPNIYISVSDTTCSGFGPSAPWVNYQNWTGSYYALMVWLNGPRGTDPITGQPSS